MTALELGQSLAVSLLLTLGLELIFSLLWGLRGRDLLLVVLVNLLTNPPVVLLYWLLCRVGACPPLLAVPLLEGAVVLTEGYYFQTRGRALPHPWRFALLLNLFSYGMGQLLQLL